VAASGAPRLELPTPPPAPTLPRNPPFRRGDKPIAPGQADAARYTRLDQEARDRSTARQGEPSAAGKSARKDSIARTALSGYRAFQGRR
jgi:hypothetical protein